MEWTKQMAEWKKQLENELAKWETEIDELKVQIKLGSMETRDKLQPKLDKMEAEYANAMKELDKLGDAAENALENIKTGVNNSVKEMKDAFDKAAKHFN